MSLSIGRIKSLQQAAHCVDMYSVDLPPVISFERNTAILKLKEYVLKGHFVRTVECDGKIVGWMVGSMQYLSHSTLGHAMQRYFCTNTSGMQAARVVFLLHDEFIEWGRAQGAVCCMSASGITGQADRLAELLSKRGWQRHNYMAIYPLQRIAEAPANIPFSLV